MALPATEDSGTSIANVGNLNYTKSPISPLISLPCEIRDNICAYLLRAGDLAILRTSKQLSHEAGERLYREGILRIKVGFPIGETGDSCLPGEWRHIQKFHFRIYFGPQSMLAFVPVIWQLRYFANLYRTSLKRECLITIEYGASDPFSPIRHEAYRLGGILEDIACLTVFTTVEVILAPKKFQLGQGIELVEFSDCFAEKTMVENRNILKASWEPNLGPAKLVGGDDSRLVFHPREFLSSLERKQGEHEP